MIGVALVVTTMATYFYIDPESPGVPLPRCMFKMLTGLQCPGCGTQRALHALLHGRVEAALRYNAALPVAVVLVLAYLLAEYKRTAWPRFYMMLNNRRAALAVAAAIALWWLGRNLAGL